MPNNTDTTQRATTWSITINNPTPADEECINLARQSGWKVEGQLEKGEEGTPHYQLLVRTPQVRFSAIKKAFPRAHIEVARNVDALKAYVHKEQTREGELPSQQEQYPSLSKFWDLIEEQLHIAGSINVVQKPAGPGSSPIVDWSLHSSDPLSEFDWAVENLIRDGYRVESLAVNPANRSAFKKYSTALLTRCLRERLDARRQADKSDTNENGFTDKDEVNGHTNALSSEVQEVHLPSLPEA